VRDQSDRGEPDGGPKKVFSVGSLARLQAPPQESCQSSFSQAGCLLVVVSPANGQKWRRAEQLVTRVASGMSFVPRV